MNPVMSNEMCIMMLSQHPSEWFFCHSLFQVHHSTAAVVTSHQKTYSQKYGGGEGKKCQNWQKWQILRGHNLQADHHRLGSLRVPLLNSLVSQWKNIWTAGSCSRREELTNFPKFHAAFRLPYFSPWVGLLVVRCASGKSQNLARKFCK